jgi:hypothetical protein
VVRRPDPGDRRRKIVEITAPGATALTKLDQLVYAADDEMLADLTAEERETLARLLERILPPADRLPFPTLKDRPTLRDASGPGSAGGVGRA